MVALAAVGETDHRKLKWFAINAWKGALQAEQSARRVRASGRAGFLRPSERSGRPWTSAGGEVASIALKCSVTVRVTVTTVASDTGHATRPGL
jgi:hypothetical protein